MLEADARQTGRPHLWGAAAESRPRHPRLHQRLRRDGLRRLERGLGLPVLRQAVRHDRGAGRAGGVRGRVPGARASYVVRADLADLDAAAGPDARRRPAGRATGPDPRRLPRRLPGRRLRLGVRRRGPPRVSASRMVDMQDPRGAAATSKADEEEGRGRGSDEAGDERTRCRAASWSRYAGSAMLALGLDLAGTGIGAGWRWPPRWPTRRSGWRPGWLAVAAAVLGGVPVGRPVGHPARSLVAGCSPKATRPARAGRRAARHSRTGRGPATWQYAAAVALILIGDRRRAPDPGGLGRTGSLVPEPARRAAPRSVEVVPRGLLPSWIGAGDHHRLRRPSVGGPPVILLALAAQSALVGARRSPSGRCGGDARSSGPSCGSGRALEAYAPAVRRLLRLHGRRRLSGRHVAAVLPADRPPVRHRHPDGADAARRSPACAPSSGVEVPLIYRRTLRSVEEIIVDSMTTASMSTTPPATPTSSSGAS